MHDAQLGLNHTYTVTKGTHALVTVQRDGCKAVIDPGVFSSEKELDGAFDGATVLLITHVHPDHVDAARVAARLASAHDLPVLAPRPVLEALEREGADPANFSEAEGKETREIGGFTVREFGGQHALIHLLIPLERNVGYILDGVIFHPGDSLAIPEQADGERLRLALVPTFTPWARHSEVADFTAAVGARMSRPIHDGPLTEQGSAYSTTILGNVISRYGTDWAHWQPGDTLSV